MYKVIVTTTINEPTKAIFKFLEKKEFDLIIVGDMKTPHDKYIELEKKYKNLIYLTPKYQDEHYKEISDYIGWNTIQRRNIGFIDAYHKNADIIATIDDDNIPYDNWGKNLLINQDIETDIYKSECNIFDLLSVCKLEKNIWHRGFPIELLNKRKATLIEKRKIKCLIQIDLWDGDPDIDAISRISSCNPKLKLNIDNPYSSIDIFPFNSQNTFISRELLPYYCVFPKCGRMDDIWGSYFLQSKFKSQDPYIIVNKPTVYQNRDNHSFNGFTHTNIDDLEREIIGYKSTLKVIQDLNFIYEKYGKDNIGILDNNNENIKKMNEFYNIYIKYFYSK